MLLILFDPRASPKASSKVDGYDSKYFWQITCPILLCSFSRYSARNRILAKCSPDHATPPQGILFFFNNILNQQLTEACDCYYLKDISNNRFPNQQLAYRSHLFLGACFQERNNCHGSKNHATNCIEPSFQWNSEPTGQKAQQFQNLSLQSRAIDCLEWPTANQSRFDMRHMTPRQSRLPRRGPLFAEASDLQQYSR